MPIYEFECQDCKKRFEKLCSMSGSNGVACPECEGTQVRKLISSFYSRSSGSDSGGSSSSSCSGCSKSSCAGCH